MKDRIVGLKRIDASKLVPHPENWRAHPDRQKRALSSAMDAIGWADAVVARALPDGTYQIIDGHLRVEQSQGKVPVLIVDLNDEEARLALASHDSIGAMAETDQDTLRALLDSLTSDNDAINDLLDDIAEAQDLVIKPVHSPEDFKEVDVDIDTTYQCPRCDYRWSGKSS